jgi:hypothetical protein
MNLSERILKFQAKNYRPFRNILFMFILLLRIKNAKVFTSAVILASMFSISAISQAAANGTTWASRTSAANNHWYSVTYGNGLFIAVGVSGAGNRVMTSPDGITWTSRASAADNNWYGVTYGDGLFVAVSYSGTDNRVMTSGEIGLAARTTAAANAEAARVAAVNAEAARKAKEQKELTEILALIPKIGELTLSLGETTKSLYSTKCVKGKATKLVKKGAKCPKGFVKK